METTQNVSAQLYFKQLPAEDIKFGCNNISGETLSTHEALSTCVNDIDSDKLIENAFQSQLNLSEYYKSPGVFNKMKENYMNKTMEGSATPEPQEVPKTTVPMVPVPQKITDAITSKSTFGSLSTPNMLLIALVVLLIVLGYFFFKR